MTGVGTPAGRVPKVFISYSHDDAPFVRDLALRLRGRGLNVWIDEIELVVGDSLVDRIGEGIQGGDFVLAVISPASISSPWCQKELRLATTRGINENRVFVLPIKHGDVELPSFLLDSYYAESGDPSGLADEIAQAVTSHLDRMRSAGVLPTSMSDVISFQEAFLRSLGIEGVEAPFQQFVFEAFMSEVFDRTIERALLQLTEDQMDDHDATFGDDPDPDEMKMINWLTTNVPNFQALWQEEAAGVMSEYKEFEARDSADPEAWARDISEQARLRREQMNEWFGDENDEAS